MDLYFISSAVFVVACVYFLCRRIFQRQIPCPRGLPLIDGLLEFLRVFGGMAHEILMKRYRELGPIYQFGFLNNKMIFLFSLTDLLKVKQVEGINPVHIDFKHLRTYRQKHGLPLGLLVSIGDEWQRQRKHMGKALLSSSVLKTYFQSVNEVAEEIMKEMEELTSPEIFDTEDMVGHYVLKSMARVLMGYEDKRHEDETVEDFTSIIETARKNFKDAKILLSTPKCLWWFTKAWSRHSGRWDKLLSITERYIDKYTKDTSLEFENDNTCVLTQLLKSEGLTDQEAHVNITDLILASIDTTSSTILWCVYELSRSKEVQDKLYQEIEEFLSVNKDFSFAGLQNLPYLRGIIRESQRLHPVGFFMSRMIQEPTTIRGYEIPKDSHVAGSMYVMGRDPEMFPEPEVFLPERWFGDNPHLETFINNVPFGFGRRMCIGRRIADLVVACFIFHLERNYTISQLTDKVIEPTFRLLMVPGEPIQIRIQSR